MTRIFLKVVLLLLLLSEGAIGQRVTEVITQGINGDSLRFPLTNREIVFPNLVKADLTDDGVSNPQNMRRILDVTERDVDWQVRNEFQLIKVNEKKQTISSLQAEMDEDSHTHILWYASGGFYYTNNVAGDFFAPLIIKGSIRAKMALGKGKVYFVYTVPDGKIYYVEYSNEGFSDSIQVYSEGYNSSPDILIDFDNKVHIIWINRLTGAYPSLMYATSVASGFVTLVLSDSLAYVSKAKILLDPMGKVHISWLSSIGDSFFINYTNNTTDEFTKPVRISIYPSISDFQFRVDNTNYSRIAWQNGEKLYYTDNSSGQFETPVSEEIEGHFSSMLIDSDGIPHFLGYAFHPDGWVIWHRTYKNNEFSKRYFPINLSLSYSVKDFRFVMDGKDEIYAVWWAWGGIGGLTVSFVYFSPKLAEVIEVSPDSLNGAQDPEIVVGQMGLKISIIFTNSNQGDLYFFGTTGGNEVKFNRESRILEFETPPVSGSKIVVESCRGFLDPHSVYFFPNPVRGDEVTFNCLLNSQGEVTVDIFDLSFDRVARLKTSGIGKIQIPWDVHKLASDVYLYQVTVRGNGGERAKVKGKLMVIR